jgi:hypothetical protein
VVGAGRLVVLAEFKVPHGIKTIPEILHRSGYGPAQSAIVVVGNSGVITSLRVLGDLSQVIYIIALPERSACTCDLFKMPRAVVFVSNLEFCRTTGSAQASSIPEVTIGFVKGPLKPPTVFGKIVMIIISTIGYKT